VTDHLSDQAIDANPATLDGLKAEKIGRRVGLTGYFVFLVFVLSGGAVSIIGQVFGSASARSASPQTEHLCAREINALKNEMIDQIRPLAGDTEPYRRPDWLRAWDQRFEKLGTNCGKYELARSDLKQLRDSSETLLIELRSQQARFIKRIERELDK
jgi:hypothetical protein